MIDFIYSDAFIAIVGISLFVTTIIIIFLGFWVGRYSHIQRMDKIFLGCSIDYGVHINIQRAGAYGLAMMFPNTIGKRLYKHVDYKTIDRKAKWPYLLFAQAIYIWIILITLWLILYDSNINL